MPTDSPAEPASATLFERIGGRHPLGVLIRNFYLALQAHPVLGPIFTQHVADWPRHYETLADFWTVQTGGPSEYHGRFLHAHSRLNLCPTHLEIWLSQWRQSCRLHFADPEATEMIALAERLGTRMREAIIEAE